MWPKPAGAHTVGVHCVDAGVICALLGRFVLNVPAVFSAIGPMVPGTGVTGVVGKVGAVENGKGPSTNVMVALTSSRALGDHRIPAGAPDRGERRARHRGKVLRKAGRTK